MIVACQLPACLMSPLILDAPGWSQPEFYVPMNGESSGLRLGGQREKRLIPSGIPDNLSSSSLPACMHARPLMLRLGLGWVRGSVRSRSSSACIELWCRLGDLTTTIYCKYWKETVASQWPQPLYLLESRSWEKAHDL
jgi:hypothetical protein